MHDAEVADDDANTQIVTDQRSRVHSEASPTLEIIGDKRTTKHKAQISSTSLTKLLYSCVVLINVNIK